MTTHYKFVGEGAGVPGLPHELTDEEARRTGVEGLLAEALKVGTYEEVVGADSPRRGSPKAVKPPAEESD